LSYLVVDVNSPDDLVPIASAMDEFDISKRTLERLIVEHGIPKFRRAGDRKTYVSRAAVLRRMGFREVRVPYDASPS